VDSLEGGELLLVPPAIADFDGDGIEDVAFAAAHAEFDILHGTLGPLDLAPARLGASRFTPPLAGDFDGDHRVDLLSVGRLGYTILWNDGAFPAPPPPLDLRAGLLRDQAQPVARRTVRATIRLAGSALGEVDPAALRLGDRAPTRWSPIHNGVEDPCDPASGRPRGAARSERAEIRDFHFDDLPAGLLREGVRLTLRDVHGKTHELAVCGVDSEAGAQRAELGPTARLSGAAMREEPAVVLELAQPSASGAIDVFDVRGRRVAGLDLGSLSAGTHAITLGAGSGVASLRPGLYFVRVRADGFEQRLRWVRLGDR
jgi:hypothetical protein